LHRGYPAYGRWYSVCEQPLEAMTTILAHRGRKRKGGGRKGKGKRRGEKGRKKSRCSKNDAVDLLVLQREIYNFRSSEGSSRDGQGGGKDTSHGVILRAYDYISGRGAWSALRGMVGGGKRKKKKNGTITSLCHLLDGRRLLFASEPRT